MTHRIIIMVFMCVLFAAACNYDPVDPEIPQFQVIRNPKDIDVEYKYGIQTKDGTYVAAGTWKEKNNDGLLMLEKFDRNGDTLWNTPKFIGTGSFNDLSGLGEFPSGDLVVGINSSDQGTVRIYGSDGAERGVTYSIARLNAKYNANTAEALAVLPSDGTIHLCGRVFDSHHTYPDSITYIRLEHSGNKLVEMLRRQYPIDIQYKEIVSGKCAISVSPLGNFVMIATTLKKNDGTTAGYVLGINSDGTLRWPPQLLPKATGLSGTDISPDGSVTYAVGTTGSHMFATAISTNTGISIQTNSAIFGSEAKGVVALPGNGVVIAGDGLLNSATATSIFVYEAFDLMNLDVPAFSFDGDDPQNPDGCHAIVQTRDEQYLITGFSTRQNGFATQKAGYMVKTGL